MRLILGDCLEVMATLPTASVDLTVTSPPYDNLRSYNESLDDWSAEKWKAVIQSLWRCTSDGGVVVWVVGDATLNGSESGSSFRQSLFAIECGFRLHDTMIWNKGGFSAVGALATRYAHVFEYMFVWSKGRPKTINPIKDRANKWAGSDVHGTVRIDNDVFVPVSGKGKIIPDFGQRFNVWDVSPQRQRGEGKHPAPFPLPLATDHVISWSNPGDVVLDPFTGSGTTGVACQNTGRDFIGIEREPKYYASACGRMGVMP